jgi:alpha-galactosidase
MMEYREGSARKTIDFDGQQNIAEAGKGWRFRYDLDLKPGAELLKAEFRVDLIEGLRNPPVFLNGYQSWTDSKEFTKKDRMRSPNKTVNALLPGYRMSRYADYEFQEYSKRRGRLHGSSWCWARIDDETVRLAASLDERTGFTFFHVDIGAGTMRVVKDCQGLIAENKGITIFDIYFSEGGVNEVMDDWFDLMRIRPKRTKPAAGWTSWYNYYQNISEEIILGNLDALKGRNVVLDIFQIDDGYQTAVGDWISVNTRFPNGMKFLADKIRKAGCKPGIWLAPFAGETKSKLFQEHPDWFIASPDGKTFATGGNWSGFYSLDLYNEEARAYIRHVFDVVLNEWGFELVKLDFLYGVCALPRAGKTRGRIMCEAMDFLRECVGNREILACGVPLWPAFGKVDYCRIGTDIDLQWHNELYGALIHRECPSTKLSIQNAIMRKHLDGRAFANDPDVFLLRKSNIQLTAAQRKTVFYVNQIFGSVLFTSDDIRLYGDDDLTFYLSSFPCAEKTLLHSSFVNGLCTASFTSAGREYWFAANLTGKKRAVLIPEGTWFYAGSDSASDGAWQVGATRAEIAPFSSVCCLKCETGKPWSLIGSFPSAFPGTEIEGSGTAIRLAKERPIGVTACISVPENADMIEFGGKKYPVRSAWAGQTTIRFIEVPVI